MKVHKLTKFTPELDKQFMEIVRAINSVSTIAPSTDSAITVTGAAGDTYTSAEKAIINALVADIGTLKNSLNDLKGKMRTAGYLAT